MTALGRDTVTNVFKHASLDHPGEHSKLVFIPADKLLKKKYQFDLLLVDEAASIPLQVLTELLKKFPRMAFASTVHGYEGTGRGFMLRFQQLLNQHTRGWKKVHLQAPIRWAKNDPVEHLLNELLLLSAEPKLDSSCIGSSTDYEIEEIDQKQLSEDKPLLNDIFGLLVQGPLPHSAF